MSQYQPRGFQVLPVVVKNLLIINGLMFFLQVVLEARGIDLAASLGLHYWRSPMFKPWQPFTHMFLHGSFMHLFSNMFALWMFGSAMENMWGPRRFLIYYLVCGFGAAVLHSLVLGVQFGALENAFYAYQQNPTLDHYLRFIRDQGLEGVGAFSRIGDLWGANPGTDAFVADTNLYIERYITDVTSFPTVGASGAVFGLLFAFGYMFPNMMIYLYFFFPLKAKYFVALYAIFELYAGFRNHPEDNIAHFAHLGGMLVGFLLLRAWGMNRYRTRY